ncbi:MAG: pilus assembly protein [bacterium]|nr:pilus assembly protein [bacterium]
MKHRQKLLQDPSRSVGNEEGATLVEMAFVLPVLVLLIFGSLEFGLAFKERLTIASAASSSARTGATMGKHADADIRILEAIEVGLYDQVDVGIIVSVEIFNADEVSGQNIGPSTIYLFNAGDPTCKWIPCPDPSHPSYSVPTWDPDSRDTTLEPGGGGLTVLGVEVIYHHTPVTNILTYLDRDFTERALVRLEPDVFGSGP